jgi:preprotein translocase subunit SecD
MSVIKAERTAEADQAAATAAVEQVEGEIRAFVRRDLSVFRRKQQQEGSEAAVENITSVIDRVSGASVTEIERVISELGTVRDMLRSEGERVQREISGYASLSQTAMNSMKIIGDSLVQWKSQSPQAMPHKD